MDDGIAKVSRSRFDPLRPLSVKFADELGSSEGAVDLGGPTKEFLRLAVQEAFPTNVFMGTASNKVIALNQEGKCSIVASIANACVQSLYPSESIYFLPLFQDIILDSLWPCYAYIIYVCIVLLCCIVFC